MRVFIGRSFQDTDDPLIRKIADFIESHGVECIDAKAAKSTKVEEKVVELISSCDVFVGVFTRYQPTCEATNPIKFFCKPYHTEAQYLTSSWVIQESGSAIGKGKALILLKEAGVCELPKLQGNLEYIEFDRTNLEEAFLKIAQMISDMQNEHKDELAESSSEKPDMDKGVTPGDPNSEEVAGKDEKGDRVTALKKVYALIFEDKYSQAQATFCNEAKPLLAEEDRLPSWAVTLRLCHERGDVSAFEKLEALVHENDNNPRIIKQLAIRYKQIGEWKQAQKYFALASKLYDLTNRTDHEGYINTQIELAWSFAKDGRHDEAFVLLNNLIAHEGLEDAEFAAFKTIAGINKELKKYDEFFIYAEAALEKKPFETDLRFELAYTYANHNRKKLSFYHYKKLIDIAPKNAVALNNLGVQYDSLEMLSKSVSSFNEAAQYDNTLAMANLADKYIAKGFIKDARAIIDKANNLDDPGAKVHHLVGQAQGKLNQIIENEAEKEKRILLEAEEQQKFTFRYLDACNNGQTISPSEIEGIWSTPLGKGQLEFSEKDHSFRITVITKKPSYLLSTQEEPDFKTLIIEGSFKGYAGTYKACSQGSMLLADGSNESGWLIFNNSSIEYMQVAGSNGIELGSWKMQSQEVSNN
ncbi:putative PEP-CTERM system TPR-repeat lipoprotein [Anaerohalosphaera lusitana]|uniref:Putative PEP-CTERM system TPR-repeat lipoprotein n=1 Tax=Anaerohalosphaera lusitana TaxID=1936003 RepID=A0A1U9NHD7_9BACT|nr:toll/interleukin-1 receptor domain-containing protein [Anaerohalosphaera lusitana]AQT67187.1 putative PEP-CTERM system TPR-repeat lipoprotein [Anaerohalosphaera lusitana]